MIKKAIRILVGIVVGMIGLTVVVWLLSKSLGNVPYHAFYSGHTMYYWQQQLYGHDVGASNTAFTVISSQVIPQLVDAMFHDTNDSHARMSLIKTLNGLPGVQINYETADLRRADAATQLGDLGPVAKSAVPDLIKALKGNDYAVHESAIISLGKIHSEPDTVIPLLLPYLDDDNLGADAAYAMGEFGGLAKPVFPKLLSLMRGGDKETRNVARAALLKIDPEAAASAGVNTY